MYLPVPVYLPVWPCQAWSALERGLVEGDPEEGSDSEKTFQKGRFLVKVHFLAIKV